MRAALLATALAVASLPAVALEVPEPGKADPHIRQVPYNPLNRTRLIGEVGRQTTITFGPDEQIARVVYGNPDAEIWLGPSPDEIKNQPLRNNLPLWPQKVEETNLQVTTTLPDGAQRVYQFALAAKKVSPSGDDDPDVVFGLIFTYPSVAQAKAAVAAQERRAIVQRDTIKARLATDVFYGERNWKYIARPNEAWQALQWPKPEVSDNGQLTAFLLRGNGVAEPAIYLVSKPECEPGGEESLAPFSNKDGMKIIPTIAQHFRLRLGDAVMEVCNKGWNPSADSYPRTGTTSPSVLREVVYQK